MLLKKAASVSIYLEILAKNVFFFFWQFLVIFLAVMFEIEYRLTSDHRSKSDSATKWRVYTFFDLIPLYSYECCMNVFFQISNFFFQN